MVTSNCARSPEWPGAFFAFGDLSRRRLDRACRATIELAYDYNLQQQKHIAFDWRVA